MHFLRYIIVVASHSVMGLAKKPKILLELLDTGSNSLDEGEVYPIMKGWIWVCLKTSESSDF